MTYSSRIMQILVAPVIAATMLAASPAMAEKLINKGMPSDDPVLAWGESVAPRNQFFLNSSDDVELVKFKRSHDLDVCAARADPVAVDGTKHGYPIRISWDAETAVIMPGNCLSFEAQRVSVRPASELPQDVELTGTVRVVH